MREADALCKGDKLLLYTDTDVRLSSIGIKFKLEDNTNIINTNLEN